MMGSYAFEQSVTGQASAPTPSDSISAQAWQSWQDSSGAQEPTAARKKKDAQPAPKDESTKKGGAQKHEGQFDIKPAPYKPSDPKIPPAERAAPKDTVVEKPAAPPDANDLPGQRGRLRVVADAHIKDPAERARFAEDMLKLEKRSSTLQDMYKKEGMNEADAAKRANQEIAQTYNKVAFLLEQKDNPNLPLREKDRVAIAEQIVRNAATPTSIDQGYHNTCNVTTLEVRAYSRTPAEAARLVVDAATTGRFVARDGTAVTLDKGSLEAHDEAKTNPPADGQRGHASQIFQVTAVNLYYQKHDPTLHYEQGDPLPGQTPPDTGERRFRYAADGTKTAVGDSQSRQPGLSTAQLIEVGNRVSGKNDTNWFLVHALHEDSGTQKIESERDLKTKLADAKAHGRLPVVVLVHSGNEPFFTDSCAGSAGGSGGWHVVTITDYKAGPPAKVSMDNQWGKSSDHEGTTETGVRQLYFAMRDCQNPQQLAENRVNVALGFIRGDYSVEDNLNVLRLSKKTNTITDADFKTELAGVIDIEGTRLTKQLETNTFDRVSWLRHIQQLRGLIEDLPDDQRIGMITLMQKHCRLDDNYVSHWSVASHKRALKTYSELEAAGKLDDAARTRMFRATDAFVKVVEKMPDAIANRMRNEVSPRRS